MLICLNKKQEIDLLDTHSGNDFSEDVLTKMKNCPRRSQDENKASKGTNYNDRGSYQNCKSLAGNGKGYRGGRGYKRGSGD